jgi:hypothetical protein
MEGADFATVAGIMRQLVIICLAAVVLAVPAGECRAADPAGTLQKALGSGEPIYKCTEGELIAATKVCAASDPRHAGEYIALILESGRKDSGTMAPALVQAAIEGLGPNPSAELIGGIVGAAVKTAPEQVLDIVRVAVKASPRSAAPEIVSAAVSSVPHPDEMVTMNYGRVRTTSYTSDKQSDFKQVSDYKNVVPTEKELTLADAIVQAAMDADPSLSQDELTTAVNEGIGGAPPNDPTVLPPGIPVPPEVPPGTGGGFNAPGPVSP